MNYRYFILVVVLILNRNQSNASILHATQTTESNSNLNDSNSHSTIKDANNILTTTISTTTNNILNITTEIADDIHIIYEVSTKSTLNYDDILETLSCDLPLLPGDYRIWKGNETRELLLPLEVASDCKHESFDIYEKHPNSTQNDSLSNCFSLRWDAYIEIQSGDVLILRIDDSYLHQQWPVINLSNPGSSIHEPTLSVYQVTRIGHENCDITEGVLLDITPLKIDNQKVITLYDKDLTLGINLLIVVSESWGAQCIRLKVIVKSDNCGENEDCSKKGLCYSNSSMDDYECQCCLGFVGQHCEEQDACYPSPCKNNGICVDISQGHEGSTFQCLCPYGYSGKTCEKKINPCASMPCQNGGSCIGNDTEFKCNCLTGFSGLLCEHNQNDCDSSPCVHGICVDDDDGYKCFCQPGFTGTHCDYEYNECESSPCINGGTCTDHVGYYTCTCGRGFTGKRCQTKIDLCEPNPCEEPKYCVDHGNTYSCECLKGHYGLDCEIPTRTVCSTNPCTNGGTCWSNKDSFYCACKPGFTGQLCEDEFDVEAITNLAIDENNDLNFHMPISMHLDHMHNIYIAVGTLLAALIIVALIVTACYCRVYKITKFITEIFSRCFHYKRCKTSQQSNIKNSDWFTGKNKAPTATPSRNLPALDTTEMYYTLDFSESQSSPLIQ